jgi:hypothetical protein
MKLSEFVGRALSAAKNPTGILAVMSFLRKGLLKKSLLWGSCCDKNEHADKKRPIADRYDAFTAFGDNHT